MQHVASVEQAATLVLHTNVQKGKFDE